ncbi:hypothetical protein FGADI_904 [Fusarium gaditjirri]|uniref:Uncharacterized protein n=1 Tax=Fusarium gaditjirri TaxID=282569 RepID=A0A8H4X3E6_9HYPO|nr:hypothetical protein FGADI_904 [Fusarium gaditjirri]
MSTVTRRWGSTDTVDIEKLVFRHEFPIKRFCRIYKLREALADIFGSDDWIVELNGKKFDIKVGRRVDLEKELKARGVIFKSMGMARVIGFFHLFEYIRF